jgi:hypothetical protein
LSPDNYTAKEGHTMSIAFLIEIAIMILRVLAAGQAG